ncbi:hypothetical protein ACFWWC_35005 [Streptomyces sp. NPDC058642]|uniref:hypothetical protein n=1 Tax=Streptomyces sp. NPDC058642 TaxID=3346572 RepID=UPI00364F01A0
MGKASRGKKERSRDKAEQWTATGAARAARRLREQTRRALADNVWVQTMLASNINNVVSELYAVLLHSKILGERHKDMLCMAGILEPSGSRPPKKTVKQTAAALGIKEPKTVAIFEALVTALLNSEK